MKQYLLCICCALCVLSCTSQQPSQTNEDPGILGVDTKKLASEIYKNTVDTLNSVEPITIIAQINHSQNATRANLELPSTQVVLFGNPKLGTPIMQQNLQAGLDLPQKFVVYQATDHSVIAYNSVDYLVKRHGVEKASTLEKIRQALSKMTTKISGKEPQQHVCTVKRDEGVISKESKSDVNTTYNKIKSFVENNPNLNIMAELDHQANAARVNMKLPPCKLIVFGNPKLGSPMMQESQCLALDLPQKMLVYQNAQGKTIVAYNDPSFLAKRHGVHKNKEIIAKVTKALDVLSQKVIE